MTAANIVYAATDAEELAAFEVGGVGTIVIRTDLQPQPQPPSGGVVGESGTLTLTSNSFNPPKSFDVPYRLIDGMVMIAMPDVNGTSASTDFIISGIPENLRPLAVRNVLCIVSGTAGYNASNVRNNGYAEVLPNGTINVSSNVNGNSWPNAGYKEMIASPFVYLKG